MIINPSSLDRQQLNELVNKVTTCSIKVCQQCCHPAMSHADRVSRGTTLAAAVVVVADVAAGHDDMWVLRVSVARAPCPTACAGL